MKGSCIVTKRKTTIALTPDVDEIIKNVMRENQLNFTEALHIIVRKYQNDTSNSVAKEVAELLKNDLTRIRLGTNNADKNSQILLEMINTMLFHIHYVEFVSTDEDPQDGFLKSKEHVRKRIHAFKTKTDSAKAISHE